MLPITAITPNPSVTGENDWAKKQPEENPADYRLVKVNINFLNPMTFKDNMQLSKHAPDKICDAVEMHCYSDCEKLKRFGFHEHGFEYCQLEKGSPLSLKIQEYAQTRRENPGRDFRAWPFSDRADYPVVCALKQFLVPWLKENNIPGTLLWIPCDGINYRDSDRSPHTVPPFYFAHVDGSKERRANPSIAMDGVIYKIAMEAEFGVELSCEEYRKLTDNESTTWLNVWIPMQEEESDEGIAFMDISSIPNLKQELRPMGYGGEIAYSLFSGGKWITQVNQTLAKRVLTIFNSTATPHTAIVMPPEEGYPPKGPRTSLEIRVMVVIPPEKPLNSG